MNIFQQHPKLASDDDGVGSGVGGLEGPLWFPKSSPAFNETKSMISFQDKKPDKDYLQQLIKEEQENGDDDLDGSYLHQPGKKRRLSADQVLYLERNFDIENKLEPERKIELANELGLQPRQVAIWFQNRRARFKARQLEKDYDVLKKSYDDLKFECDSVFKENEKFKNEILILSGKLQCKDGSPKSEPNDPLHSSPTQPMKHLLGASNVICKQEATTSSAKSEIFDSESTHSTGKKYTSLLRDPTNSSPIFEPNKSGFLQEDDEEEDDLIAKNFMQHPLSYSKIGNGCYKDDDLSVNSCNFGFQDEDEQPFWLSHY